ncbi:MAG: type IV pilin [Thermoplasmata archaeon]|nr:type IV pilin [Thermoplasmata archaeon]
MRKWIKNKAGVSPIIAIILMVAITVVLAATIYVWVSGMGKGGTSAPNLAATADNINHRLIISQADKGIKWSDITISVNQTGVTPVIHHLDGSTGATGDVKGGEYITFSAGSYTGPITVTLTYKPTNTNFGTWTIYLS